MSKNFYATVKVVGDEATPEFRMHLGKTTSNTSMVDGNMFESFASMVNFLRYNVKNVRIEDEYGAEYSVEEFVKYFTDDFSMNAHNFKKYYEDSDRNWMDDDGFIVSTGVWC